MYDIIRVCLASYASSDISDMHFPNYDFAFINDFLVVLRRIPLKFWYASSLFVFSFIECGITIVAMKGQWLPRSRFNMPTRRFFVWSYDVSKRRGWQFQWGIVKSWGQTTFSNAFSCMKMFVFWLIFRCNLFPRVPINIIPCAELLTCPTGYILSSINALRARASILDTLSQRTVWQNDFISMKLLVSLTKPIMVRKGKLKNNHISLKAKYLQGVLVFHWYTHLCGK